MDVELVAKRGQRPAPARSLVPARTPGQENMTTVEAIQQFREHFPTVELVITIAPAQQTPPKDVRVAARFGTPKREVWIYGQDVANIIRRLQRNLIGHCLL